MELVGAADVLYVHGARFVVGGLVSVIVGVYYILERTHGVWRGNCGDHCGECVAGSLLILVWFGCGLNWYSVS